MDMQKIHNSWELKNSNIGGLTTPDPRLTDYSNQDSVALVKKGKQMNAAKQKNRPTHMWLITL